MQMGNVCRHLNQHREGPGIRWCSDCGRKEPEACADHPANLGSKVISARQKPRIGRKLK